MLSNKTIVRLAFMTLLIIASVFAGVAMAEIRDENNTNESKNIVFIDSDATEVNTTDRNNGSTLSVEPTLVWNGRFENAVSTSSITVSQWPCEGDRKVCGNWGLWEKGPIKNFHEGIDIPGKRGITEVIAVKNGTIHSTETTANGDVFEIKVEVSENEYHQYGHIQNHSGIELKLTTGTSVVEGKPFALYRSGIGEHLGNVGTFEHIHFSISNGVVIGSVYVNPLIAYGNIDPSASTGDNKPDFGEIFYKQGDKYEWDKVGGKEVISGDIDIVVEITDDHGYVDDKGAVGKYGKTLFRGTKSVPYKIGYWIDGPDTHDLKNTGTDDPFLYLFEFNSFAWKDVIDNIIDMNNIYDTNLKVDVDLRWFHHAYKCYCFIVTNTGADESKFWDTKLKEGGGVAKHNYEAEYPDDLYKVIVKAEDLVNSNEATYEVYLDNFPPIVESTTPTKDATCVPLDTNIVVNFDEKMDTASVESAFSISPSASGTFSWSNNDKTLTVNPSYDLEKGTTYIVTIETGAKDLVGKGIDGDADGAEGPEYSWSFETIGCTQNSDCGEPTIEYIPCGGSCWGYITVFRLPYCDHDTGNCEESYLTLSVGCDCPDDNFDVSSDPCPCLQNMASDDSSKIGVLNNGFYYYFMEILADLNESAELVDINAPIEELKEHSVLIIPTGGMYGISSSKTFESKLEQYVNDGGTLIAFSQQHGYEFNTLPGDVSGYGWAEDQNCHYNSVGIITYNPIFSGQSSMIMDVNVDGYFTRYPTNTTILLTRTKNAMPAMIMYNHGDGRIIASALYTDYAYAVNQMTEGERILLRDLISWVKDQKDIEDFGSGDTIDIPITITNDANIIAENVSFTIIDPEKNVLDYVNISTTIFPEETKTLNFTYTAPSKLGIWWIDYSLFNSDDTVIQTMPGVETFAVSKYAENPDGWVYQGSNITISLTTPSQDVVSGSYVDFFMNIRNNGDTDKNLTLKFGRGHTGLNPNFLILQKEIDISAHGSVTVPYTITAFGMYFAEIYEKSKCLGSAGISISRFSPSIDVNVGTDRQEYTRGEEVSILLDLKNKQNAIYNTTVEIRAFDPDNTMIFEDSFDITLAANTSENKTFRFSLPSTSWQGIHLVTAETYCDGKKIGSSSSYFKVMESYMVKMTFDNKTHRIRENVSFDLEITNIGFVLWSSEVNISIPGLAFEDSKYVSLNPENSGKISYNLFIPETTPAGKHDVIVTMGVDNLKRIYYFIIPNSNLVINSEKTNYNAGDNLSTNLTNIGGIDTTYNCSIKFYDRYAILIYENDTVQEDIKAGESKPIEFKIPDQSVSGIYYLIIEYTDLNTTNKIIKSVKSYDVSGLEASLTSVTDKKVYFSDEDVFILTNITNIDDEIVNGTLNLKIAYSYVHDLTTKSSSYSKANSNLGMPLLETFADIEYDRDDSVMHESYQHPVPMNELEDVYPHPTSPEHYNPTFDIEPPAGVSNYDHYETSIGNSDYISDSIVTLSSNIWHVPDDYPTIQAAVNASSAGDTIIVRNGTYKENVDVNKRLTVRSENGSAYTIVRTANINDHVFEVTADYVNISGLKLIGEGYQSGILLSCANHCNISDNTASNNECGICLGSSSYNMLTNNTANSNKIGIFLSSSSYNIITNNTANSNKLTDGIFLSSSSYNIITNNTANSNNWAGICLSHSSNNNLTNNMMSGNRRNFDVDGWKVSHFINNIDTTNKVDGKTVYYWVNQQNQQIPNDAGYVGIINSTNITVKDLTLTNNLAGVLFAYTSNSSIENVTASNNYCGIELLYSSNNKITNNNASHNYQGIHLNGYDPYYDISHSKNNIITNNYVSDNSGCGIYLMDSSDNMITNNYVSNNRDGIWLYLYSTSNNVIYNNYFNNTVNVPGPFATNTWNITRTSGTNIVGGPWLGGNYWSDYTGNDTNGDCIGDTLLPYNCSGNIRNGGDYLPLIKPMPPIGKTIWETNITINMGGNETKNIVTDVPMDVLRNVTGKLELIATFYNHINLSQTINQSNIHSFFITDKNTSLILETDKRVYKPNETITIFGKVKNNATITDDYNFSITKEGEEIFFDTFMLSSGETYDFNTTTTFNTSFTLEGTANDVIVTDFIKVEPPTVNVSVIAPEVVGLGDFDVGILIENIGDVPADLNVCIKNNTWNITVIEKESKLIQNKMNITKNTTLTVNITGDVNKTIQKKIICGENAKINITPQSTYLDGTVEIPYTIENFGILDSRFNATFSIDNQTISESFLVPKGQNITDTISFNLSKGAHLLKYTSPFEKVNETINVLSPPEFIVTSIHPEDMNFTLGQNVTMTFIVENIGGTEGEVTLRLLMPDFEDTNRTWVRSGEKENMSFSFVIPDDLEEKNYKGIYEFDGAREGFTFFVQGAEISVNASLDKNLYEEGEIAILTLDITNECPFDLSLYTRVKLSDYEEIKHFNLTDFETLQFDVPVHFNGQKLFYGIYMESGRALYLNGMYVHKKEIITLYTDKQVYNAGENVTVFVDTTKSGTLNLTAPEFNRNMLLTGSATIEFELPEEMRSGTYYIEYDFDNFSSAYPFDVIGYSARILECSLDKEVYDPVDIVNVKMDVEVNQNIAGVLKTWIYNSESNLIDTFETDVNFQEGENKIALSRKFSSDHSGIHVLGYGIYAPDDLIFLASGAEYFDVIFQNTPPSSITNLHFIKGHIWLNWTWLNPPDPDFNHTEIYLDGVFRTITSAEHFNATSLAPETSHTISTRTVDTAGNISQTWVNNTARTAALHPLLKDDAYHYSPDSINDHLYTEWWYFNVYNNDRQFMVTYFLTDPANLTGLGGAEVLAIVYNDMPLLGHTSTSDFSADYEKPNVTIGSNTLLALNNTTIVINGSCRDINTNTQIQWNLTYTMNVGSWFGMPAPIHVGHTPDDWMQWLSYMTGADVAGTITIDETTYNMSGRGYHDHNWGEWLFDDPQWNWAQVSLPEENVSLIIGDVVAPPARSTMMAFKYNGTTITFDDIDLTHTGYGFDPITSKLYPDEYHITGNNDEYSIDVAITAAKNIPIVRPFPGALPDYVIFEQVSDYNITLFKDYEPVYSLNQSGFSEYTAHKMHTIYGRVLDGGGALVTVTNTRSGWSKESVVASGYYSVDGDFLDYLADTPWMVDGDTLLIEAVKDQNSGNTTLIVNMSMDKQQAPDLTLQPMPWIFDTGSGTYPSIFGRHTGTIKPLHDVNVSTMYTYPCNGTGGHSEYVRIYGNGVDVNGTWNGYMGGDYHHITFSVQFTLLAGHTYNYMIETGSYPQIHHTRILKTPDGEITCAEFVDANGKRYDNRIPAFRLESS